MTKIDTKPEEIGRHMAKGAAWAILIRLAVRGLGVISTLILARLLAPEDYGMIAMATVLLGAVEGITAFGFDAVLVQDQAAGRDKYDTAWTMGVIRGVVLALAFALAAPFLADFYHEARLVPLIYLLALGTFIEGFESVGIVDFRKHLRFDRDFILQLIPRLISFIATLALAFTLHVFWALAYGILICRTSRVVTGFVMHPYRPHFTLARWREIFKFSKWLMVNSALRFVDNSGDTLVLGRYVPPTVLGFYTIAYEISNLALTELIAPIQRAVVTGLFAHRQGLRDLARHLHDDVLDHHHVGPTDRSGHRCHRLVFDTDPVGRKVAGRDTPAADPVDLRRLAAGGGQ